MTWTKLPPLPGRNNPCLHCPPIVEMLAMERVIAVGFGSATVTRDGDEVYSEPQSDDAEYRDVAWAEEQALKDPDHDWQIMFYGAMHNETYQRHGVGQWVLVEAGEGFA